MIINKIVKILLFTLLLFLPFTCLKSQVLEYENKISQIDSIVAFTQKKDTTSNQRNDYMNIFIDGIVYHKFLGILPTKKIKGGFFGEYLVNKPDNRLISYFTGIRIFNTHSRKKAYNLIKYFVYDNENLCYYSEEMYFEKQGENSIKVYEVKYYIEKEAILKTTIKGNFEKNTNSYFPTILFMARQNVMNKNHKTITYNNNE